MTCSGLLGTVALIACGSDDESAGSGGSAGSGAGGAGGSGGIPGADDFCKCFETTCGFVGTERFTSMAHCKSLYPQFSDERKKCVNTHLGMVEGTSSLHCVHASGAMVCALGSGD